MIESSLVRTVAATPCALAALAAAGVVACLAATLPGCGSLIDTESPDRYVVTVRGAGMLAPMTVGVRSRSGSAEEQTLEVDGLARFTLDYSDSAGFALYIADSSPVPCSFDVERQVVETASAEVYLVCLLSDLSLDGPQSYQMEFWPSQDDYEVSMARLTESIGLVARAAHPDVVLLLGDESGAEPIDLTELGGSGGLGGLGEAVRVAGLPLYGDTWRYDLEASHPPSGWQRTYTLLVRRGDEIAHAAYVKPGDTAARDRFGFSLAMARTGDRMLVGAPFSDRDADGGGLEDRGAGYVFARDGRGKWRQVDQLVPGQVVPGPLPGQIGRRRAIRAQRGDVRRRSGGGRGRAARRRARGGRGQRRGVCLYMHGVGSVHRARAPGRGRSGGRRLVRLQLGPIPRR